MFILWQHSLVSLTAVFHFVEVCGLSRATWRVMGTWEDLAGIRAFPQIRIDFWGSLNNDYRVPGSILGSPYLR